MKTIDDICNELEEKAGWKFADAKHIKNSADHYQKQGNKQKARYLRMVSRAHLKAGDELMLFREQLIKHASEDFFKNYIPW